MTSINDKNYFNIEIDKANKTYSIKSVNKKPKGYDSGLSALKNINNILGDKEFTSTEKLGSKKAEHALELIKVSSEIRDAFKAKAPSIFERVFKSQSKKVESSHQKINNSAIKLLANAGYFKDIQEKTGIQIQFQDATRPKDAFLEIKIVDPTVSMAELSMHIENLSKKLDVTLAIEFAPQVDLSGTEGIANFLESHGSLIKSMDLRDLNNKIDDEFIDKAIKLCPNLSKLYLKSNKIEGKGLSALSTLKHLTLLDLSKCQVISELPTSWPPNLKSIDLSGCFLLTELPKIWPAGLSTVKLSGLFDLSALPKAWPDSLTTIDLGRCSNLYELPNVWPAGLTSLNLDSCYYLPVLPKAWPASLTSINLSYCTKLNQLPKNWPSGLKLLDLSRNELRELPKAWPNSLELLNISKCPQLDKLPAAWPHSLKSIDLSYCNNINQIPALPDDINSLKLSGVPHLIPSTWPSGLTFLDISKSQDLRELTAAWPTGLTGLNISQCPLLSKVPDAWPIGLSLLNLSHSKNLNEVPKEWPLSLKKLDLSNRESFEGLPTAFPGGLESLDLSSTNLAELHIHWPSALTSLDLPRLPVEAKFAAFSSLVEQNSVILGVRLLSSFHISDHPDLKPFLLPKLEEKINDPTTTPEDLLLLANAIFSNRFPWIDKNFDSVKHSIDSQNKSSVSDIRENGSKISHPQIAEVTNNLSEALDSFEEIMQTNTPEGHNKPSEVSIKSQSATAELLQPNISREQAITKATKAVANVQRTIDNLNLHNEILPELHLSHDLIPQLTEVKLAVEIVLEKMKSKNSHENFDQSMGVLKEQKQQMKSLLANFEDAVAQWETKLAEKITFKIDNESDKISEEYGNKHSRLLEQATLLSQIKLPGVEVPIPRGISNTQIQGFLRNAAPEVNSGWDELRQLYDSFKAKGGDPTEFLKQPEVSSKLEAIHQSITNSFAQAAMDENVFNELGVQPEFLEWMEELKAKNSYLMVRSSGAEDTHATANAGGNVSVAYVNPEREDLCQAIGKVVVSYFSEGSLQNRLNADDDPFSSPLRLAVTSQELIGEPVGGATKQSDIPVSLVLFSNEPTYVGNEPFRLMRISATWGHGEGVVGAAGVKSDTILILKSVKHPDQLYIVENNQAKPKRLAPVLDSQTGKVSLEKLNNSPELEGKPALDQTMLTRLYYLGVAVEKAYEGHPMDMEIVVKDGKIYPVQARPVNRPPSNPTYFDWKKANALNPAGLRSFQAEAFLPGLAQTQIIRSKDEILIVDNLEKAEKLFKKGRHKIVIVREEEPANSHPVVNFSGMGIPVMFHEKSEPIQSLVDQIGNNQPLIACVQSGNLVLWNSKEPPESSISSGYTVHPAKVAVSVASTRLPSVAQAPEVPQEIKELTAKLRALETHDVALEAVKSLKNQNFVTELSQKRTFLAEKISSNPNASQRAKDLVKGLEGLETSIARAASELKATLKKGDQERLHPLFHGKVVETLFQQAEAPRGLGQLSVVNAKAQIKAVEEIFHYQESFPFPTILHDEVLAASACMSSEQEVQWKTFLTQVENAHHDGSIPVEDIERLKEMLGTIEKLDLLPMWMARIFLPEVEKAQDISKTLSNILETVDAKTESKLIEMHEILQEIHACQDSLNLFSDASTFDKGWKQLMSLHQKMICHEGAKAELEGLQPLGRIATYQVMEAFVDLYDSSIKSMKASTTYSDPQKGELFNQMLNPYYELLEGLTKELSGDLLQYHYDWPLEKYLNTMKEQFEKTGQAADELSPSGSFSVSAGILGATTAFERALPKTKEDFFTLTHQNLLFSLGALLGSEMKGKTQLPPLIQQANDLISQLPKLPNREYFTSFSKEESTAQNIQLLGYNFSDDKLTLNYNYPLRQHSASFSITFDKKTQSCQLEAKFVGEARNRYGEMGDVVQTLAYFKEIELIEPPQESNMELTYSLNISDSEGMERALIDIRQQAEFTMGIGVAYNMPEYIQNKYGQEALSNFLIEVMS